MISDHRKTLFHNRETLRYLNKKQARFEKDLLEEFSDIFFACNHKRKEEETVIKDAGHLFFFLFGVKRTG
jgi:phosphoribosyl-ATP pyrophosphohydrolase